MCKISIITVCYNARDLISETISSVLQQSCSDFEYIIIDGNSTDGTVELIMDYQHKFLELGIKMIVVSERDLGIYNAMNKGIAKSNGEWLIFLNAGDYLCDKKVVERMIPILNENHYDVVYGDVIFRSRGMYKYSKSIPLFNITNEMIFCHQCIFISRRSISNFLYDESYSICSDHDLFIKLYMNGYKFYDVKFPISVFSIGGISNNYTKRDLERVEVLFNNGLIDDKERKKRIRLIHYSDKKRNFINKIKRFIPKKFIINRWKRYYKKDGWTKEFPKY